MRSSVSPVRGLDAAHHRKGLNKSLSRYDTVKLIAKILPSPRFRRNGGHR
jgi:hypothetical protein